MRQIVFYFLAVLLLFTNHSCAQKKSKESFRIKKNTIIKDESGNIVKMSKFTELMDSGEWVMKRVTDDKGKLLYIKIRKATDIEQEKIAKLISSNSNSDIIGKDTPDFNMEDIHGNQISKANTKGKIVVLNFWFAACKPCIEEIPELNQVYEKYKNNPNVIFASITFDDRKKVDAFLKKHPMKYPIVSNARKTHKLFNILGYPTNIVIDKDGKYYSYLSSGFPKIGRQISNSIQDALDGKERN